MFNNVWITASNDSLDYYNFTIDLILNISDVINATQTHFEDSDKQKTALIIEVILIKCFILLFFQ
jgi:hypothetical protein